MKASEIKLGAFLSYITVGLNSLVGILFTPFLIGTLGQVEYGLYQLIYSFAAYLIVLDFGIGNTATRFLVKYISKKDHKGAQNYTAMLVIIGFVLSLCTFLISLILFFNIDLIFSNSLNHAQLNKAKILFIIMAANVSISLFQNSFNGIITAYEKFIFTNSLKISRIVFRVAISVALLLMGFDSVALVLADLFTVIASLVLDIIYYKSVIKVRIRLFKWENSVFRQTFFFSAFIFLEVIVNQVNGNVDKMILGVMTNTSIVAVYSIAMQIFIIYNSFSTALSTVFLPRATRLVVGGASEEELTDFIAKPGRYQFMILGSALSGFILFGREFISLWVGKEFSGAWLPAVIVMVPTTVPLIQNVTLSVIKAKNKHYFRAVALAVIALCNVLLTVLMVNLFSYVGAAVSTAIAMVVGNIIILNIYYQRVIGLNIKRMFLSIFKGIFPCLLTAFVIGYFITFIPGSSWMIFMVRALVFMAAYGVLLYKFGMNKIEKALISGTVRKIFVGVKEGAIK